MGIVVEGTVIWKVGKYVGLYVEQPPCGAPTKAVLSIFGDPKMTTQTREVQEAKA